jgi:hypothetical protein
MIALFQRLDKIFKKNIEKVIFRIILYKIANL